MNPIEKIQFGKEYVSGPKATTDLHVGGIFFCILYEEVLIFHENGDIELTKRVIERFRPMDGQDVDRINNFQLNGKFFLSDRNYIVCEFPELKMTGLPLEKHPNMIAFDCHQKGNSSLSGKAFQLKYE